MTAIVDFRRNSKVVPVLLAERTARLAELRQVLAEKYPTGQLPKSGILPTGIGVIDRVEGGLRVGAVTEISGRPGGSSLMLAGLVSMLAREKRLGALVDCGEFFDPGSIAPELLKRLLWVRSGTPGDAVKTADLLLRDGNLSLLMLDLQGAELRGVGRVPANTWHRFQRVVEQSSMSLVVFTSRPLVEGASVRVAAEWGGNFEAIADRRTDLLARLSARISSRRSVVGLEGLNLRTA
jgi:hypothetical protein